MKNNRIMELLSSPSFYILIGGILAAFASYIGEIKSNNERRNLSEKISTLEENLKKSTSELEDYKNENRILSEKLHEKSEKIDKYLSGGNSFPIYTYSYNGQNPVLKITAKIEGENHLNVYSIIHINKSELANFYKNNIKPTTMNPNPFTWNNWNSGEKKAKFNCPIIEPARLLAGDIENTLKINSTDMSFFHKSNYQVELEIKTVAENGVYFQTTKLLFIAGHRWPFIAEFEKIVRNESGDILLHKIENYYKSGWEEN